MSTRRLSKAGSERVMFTLPRSLATELEEYARLLRNGNKSGFVADAIRSYIAAFRKRRHTELLRRGYAASAERSADMNREWEPLDDEISTRLDELEKRRQDRT